ncbi:putative Ig domain-containing protein [Luteolibacter marinus]|uniref:putative Ig domain-containing protein n=1 Tax=Luteolibacter marinus TaxID=2776705 RepID=UPI001866BD21|nr:putative Ig domain-containing protein [Luteolibacter marinus]
MKNPFFCLLTAALAMIASDAAVAATFSVPGFVQETIYQGNGMISMRFDFAGRLWVCEKQGRVLVFTPTSETEYGPPVVFADLVSQVNTNAESGMTGLTLDPDFEHNRYLYVLFATASDQRILRLTSNEDGTAVVPGSEVVLLSGLPNTIGVHKAGDIAFHPDDPHNLYVMIGDDGNRNLVGDLDLYNGKILKISASDGKGLATNPYYTGDVNSVRSRVWSARYRNPFRFTFDPAAPIPDVLYISENGDGTDRIARIEKGADGGWPDQFTNDSGDGKRTILQTSSPSKTGIAILRNGPLSIGGAPTLYHARHNSEVRRWTLTGAGLDTLTPVPADAGAAFAENFGHNIASFTAGPDGALYYTSSDQGPATGTGSRLARIRFIGGTQPAADFTASPASGQWPLEVTFTDTSAAPDSSIASWSWNFGDGSSSTAQDPVHTYAGPGVYPVTLTVANTEGLEDTSSSTVTAWHQTQVTFTGQVHDGRVLPAAGLAAATELHFYQKDGITPLAVTGGTGPEGNVLAIAAGGEIDLSFSAQVTGDAMVVSAGEAPGDGVEPAFAGVALSTTEPDQAAEADFFLSDTMLRGRIVDTLGVPARVDLGVSRGSAGNYYDFGGGRDFLAGSGIAASGNDHRVVPDVLGYYHVPVRSGTGSVTFHLDTTADTLTASHGKVKASVAVGDGESVVQDLVIGLYHGGTGEVDLSGIAVTPDVDFATQIEPILSGLCSACHNDIATNSYGLDLQAGTAYSELVDKESGQAPGVMLVQSGSAARSYLMEKLGASPPQVGTSMRPGDPMAAAQQALIRDWINQLTPPDPDAPPEIDSALAKAAVVGTPFSYQITAINIPTAFGATNLPAGLDLNPVTGVISGTPTADGTVETIITATNANGTDTETLVFTITPGPPPEITSPLAVTAAVNVAFSYLIAADHNPVSFTATGLPAGFSINPATGEISGTPVETGSSTVAITATNANGTDSGTLEISFIANLSVGQPTATSSDINAGSTGAAAVDLDFNGSRWESVHGVDPQWIAIDLGAAKEIHRVVLKWENAAGEDYQLQVADDPAGPWIDMVVVTGNAATGEIVYDNLGFTGRHVRMYGTSRTTPYGYSLYNFEVWGMDLDESVLPPVITSSLTANAIVGSPFSYTIAATRNPTAFAAGGLPDGLEVDTATGEIHGTPAAPGSSDIAISATNANGTANATLVLTVTTGPLPEITSALAANGTVGTPFNYGISATNAPESFTASGLPAGLSLDPATGVISGVPGEAFTGDVAITATNAHGTATAMLALVIAPDIVNLSVGQPTATSSDINAGSTGAAAVDLDFNGSRWESVHGVDPQWMSIDLGAPKSIRKVVLKWEFAGGKDYLLQVADDPAGPWTDMVTVTGNTTTGVDLVYDNLDFTGRHVRMYGTIRTTGYGYSLYNFEVWGGEPPAVSPFDAWRQESFGELAGDPEALSEADFDRDGRSNLLEFVLGTDPVVSGPDPGYASAVGESGRLELSFNRPLQMAGVTVTVSASDSLLPGSWEVLATRAGDTAWTVAPGVAVADPGTGAVIVTDSKVIPGVPPRRFLRLGAELTP